MIVCLVEVIDSASNYMVPVRHSDSTVRYTDQLKRMLFYLITSRVFIVAVQFKAESTISSTQLKPTEHSLTICRYSERLVSILDEKIAATVALRLRENSESGMSGGLPSPALEKGEVVGYSVTDANSVVVNTDVSYNQAEYQ